jgi:hypothetical protein
MSECHDENNILVNVSLVDDLMNSSQPGHMTDMLGN